MADVDAARVRDPDRRALILRGAGELFATKGVAATTVREIGTAAGLLSGSLYHYFDSKEAMVEAIVAAFLEDLSAGYATARAAQADPQACLAEMIRVSFRQMAKHPYACHIFQHDFNYLRTLPRFTSLDAMARESEHAWLDVIEAGVVQGQLRDDIDPLVFYRFNRDAIFLTVRWYREGGQYSLEHLAESCIAIFLQGYAVAPKR